MSAGALDTAALMFADVREMLFSKLENPLAAAAAGYVLIGTEVRRDRRNGIRGWRT